MKREREKRERKGERVLRIILGLREKISSRKKSTQIENERGLVSLILLKRDDFW
jgi:hypothetical protein